MIMNTSAWWACCAALLVTGLISAPGLALAKYEASTGAWALCEGPKVSHGSAWSAAESVQRITTATATATADAAGLAEDITPGGVRAYGQSGPSVAEAGDYAVEAWSDATGLYAPCPSPDYKEELTGIGFSANGGASFTDLGGLPNNSSSGLGPSDMALAACQASGSGNTARLRCGQPVIVATSAAVPPCGSIPTADVMTKVPLSWLPMARVSPCKDPAAKASVQVVSMTAAEIPGFAGVPNDFPRPAVSPRSGTVSMVWNDARYAPLGGNADIWMLDEPTSALDAEAEEAVFS